MERYTIEQDIKVLCVNADSFPEGIADAHRKLQSMLPSAGQRGIYGVSWSDGKGGIIYKAAAEQLEEGEAASYGLDTFVIRKGEYLGELLLDFPEHMDQINNTFQKLLALPELDPRGYCLEFYLSAKDMRCMVPVIT